MTEKRFRSQIDECGVYYYICEDGEILAEGFYKDDAEDIAKRLNEQHKEIQRLQESLNYSGEYITAKKKKGAWRNNLIDELKKENEQLKSINKYLIEILEHSGATVKIENIKGDVE